MSNQRRLFNFVETKKLLAIGILAATSSVTHSVLALSTTEPPIGWESKPVITGKAVGSLQSAEVLLIEDVYPWGTTANEDVLALPPVNGKYEVINSGQIAGSSFDNYKVVIVASDQPQSFYDIYGANLGKFTDYVSEGGCLVFNGADMGWEGGFWNHQLPGGVTHQHYYDWMNLVVKDHPIVSPPFSPSDSFSGSYASHDHFLNYQGVGADVITQDEASLPTTIEYSLGNGRVIASGVTLEAGYGWGWDYAQLLPNTIKYAYENCGHATCLGNRCILGTDGDDYLVGTNGDDVICGGKGNDVILGAQGDDVICGGPGNDILIGNEGYDIIEGEEGDDFLEGDKDIDVLQGGEGNDVIQGDLGNDFLFGGMGQDSLDGGGGANLLNGGTDTDLCEPIAKPNILIGCNP